MLPNQAQVLTLIRARDGKTDEIKLGEFLAKHTVREGWILKTLLDQPASEEKVAKKRRAG